MPAQLTAATGVFSAPRDYLIFVAAALCIFLTLALLLPRLRKRARLPWPVWSLTAIVLVGGWWTVERAGDEARFHIQRVVSALAPTYAIELERMGHAQLTLDMPADDPRYLAIVAALRDWEKVNPFAHDIYTVRKRADGRNVFLVDAESDYDGSGKIEGPVEERTEIGAEFAESDAGLETAFRGEANFNPEIVRDRWGEWVGAWAPIHAPDGTVEAAVGVDFSARKWLAAIAAARRDALLQLGLALSVVALGGLAFALARADFAERLAAEERSRQTEQRLQFTIRHMPLGFIEWDTEGRVLAWNPSAERIFGYKRSEVLGQAIAPRIVPPAAQQHLETIWTNLRRNTGGVHSISEHLAKDGRSLSCEWFNTPIVDADGQVTGVMSLLQDITERLNLEKQVQQAQRLTAVGQLAAGVAHDFNNILTIITGHAGLLLEHEDLPADALPELERIEEAAVRAGGLTRQLLAFSRQQAMFPRPLHLRELIDGTAPMLARMIGEAVTFTTHFGETLPPIEADPAMLEQVITNLVLNARDAMPRGGTITVVVEAVRMDAEAVLRLPDAQLGTAVRLSIRDTGDGIPAENLSRIFEPFFTTKKAGNGLGLSVVHGIVKQHHGWIEVESSSGQGTAFHVFFPPTNREPETDALRRTPLDKGPANTPRKTILLVEDEEIVRELARMILERAGYQVLEAPDGPTALKLWAEHAAEVDMLVTDMVMPNGITGRELSLRLLAERPGLPIIYASGYSIELTAPDFRETERQIFLQKPYLTDQLVATVQRCFGVHGSHSSPRSDDVASASIAGPRSQTKTSPSSPNPSPNPVG